MATPSPKNLLLGAGQVLFNRFDASGNKTGLRHLGNIPKFNLKTEVEKITKKSSMNASRSTYDEAVKETKISADLDLEEFDPANIALALFGEEGIITQEAAVVTGEVHRAFLGRYIQLDAFNPSSIQVKPLSSLPASIAAAIPVGSVASTGTITTGGIYSGATAEDYYLVVTAAPTTAGNLSGCTFKWKKGLTGALSPEMTADSAAQVLEDGIEVSFTVTAGQTFAAGDTWKIAVSPAINAYEAGVDYQLDPVLLRGGLVLVPDSSRIPDNTDITVDYQKSAGTFPKIAGGMVNSIEGELMFIGDPAKGPCYNGQFWRVSITPGGELGLISEEYATFPITVTVLDDRSHHPDEPFHRLVKVN